MTKDRSILDKLPDRVTHRDLQKPEIKEQVNSLLSSGHFNIAAPARYINQIPEDIELVFLYTQLSIENKDYYPLESYYKEGNSWKKTLQGYCLTFNGLNQLSQLAGLVMRINEIPGSIARDKDNRLIEIGYEVEAAVLGYDGTARNCPDQKWFDFAEMEYQANQINKEADRLKAYNRINKIREHSRTRALSGAKARVIRRVLCIPIIMQPKDLDKLWVVIKAIPRNIVNLNDQILLSKASNAQRLLTGNPIETAQPTEAEIIEPQPTPKPEPQPIPEKPKVDDDIDDQLRALMADTGYQPKTPIDRMTGQRKLEFRDFLIDLKKSQTDQGGQDAKQSA